MKHPFDGALILSVDDNEASRYAIARTLKEVGFRVTEAATGHQGLRRARTEAPDLILLDVKLPDIDGFEVSRQLKADPVTSSIPVLQMTATYGSKENWAAALDAGADAYLTHPAEPIVLVATIRALLRAREAERALREANRLKDDFLATLSHELRTPLNAIVGWAHVLRTPKLDPAIVARAVESIQRNAEAQTRLVADILDVSRIVTGKLRIDSRRVDLAKVTEAALETVRPSTVGRQIGVEYVATPDLIVHGDASRLQQIVWNLLANAVKFTPTGGRVRLEVRRSVSNVEIVVEDTGMGIDPTFLPHVFDRFRQADASMTRSFGGLGLGLALVRDLVHMHGGTVRAESEGKDLGSRFTVVLPSALPLTLPPTGVETGTVTEPAAMVEAPLQRSGPAVVTGIRVLIVDDDVDFLESLEVALGERGAVVKTATSVQTALAAMESSPPDVLISDLGMPEEDGYALIRAVRARFPAGLPAIALTAYAADHDRERSLAAGYQRHVGKPADPTAIIQAIAELAAPPAAGG